MIESKTTLQVRQADMNDIVWLYGAIERMDAEHNYGFMGDHVYVIDKLKEFLEFHVVFIAEKTTMDSVEKQGFIMGWVGAHLFNQKMTILNEILWWVEPERRHSWAGATLLKKFVNWGKKNVDLITFGIQKGTPIREESLKRMGFELQERCFIMEVK